MFKPEQVDALIAKQLQRSIVENGRLKSALRYAINLFEENGLPNEAATIAKMAALSDEADSGRDRDDRAVADISNHASAQR